MRFIATAQDIGVERMDRAVFANGAFGGDERLGNHLPTEHAAFTTAPVVANEHVVASNIDIEQVQQAGNERFGAGLCGHGGTSGLACRLRQRKTPPG